MARYVALQLVPLPSSNSPSLPTVIWTNISIDNSTYSAITAVVSANVVLVTYIIASVLEDKGDQASINPTKTAEIESRKTR